MMLIHPIQADEIAAFAALNTPPEHTDAVQHYTAEMIAQDAMRPDRCFVAEQDGKWLGRVAYWTLPRLGIPLDIVLLDTGWDDAGIELGARLLQETVPMMRAAGGGDIGYALDTPPQWPQWQFNTAQRHQALTAAGFVQQRETSRFERDIAVPPPPQSDRLVFRSFDEVGEAVFLDAIERVTAGTFDQRLTDDEHRLGSKGAARLILEELQTMDYEPAWWNLAYNRGGDLVGLVMPAGSPTFGTIGHIGVVPEQRGNGYVDDLLALGTATLCAIKPKMIRTDTDISNFPMANAFRRAGYTQFATRREYVLRA